MAVASTIGPSEALSRYRVWLYAAAGYNLLWGATNVLFPSLLFRLVGISQPTVLPLWQVVGMFVLVFAPGYWWAARQPARHPHIILIGKLGKILGPVGFVWAATTHQLPIAFGATILTNDLLWWPAFACYLRDSARLRGGCRAFLIDK